MNRTVLFLLILTLSGRVVAAEPLEGRPAVVRNTARESILEFDFPAVHVGTAEYEEGPTGVTVFYFPQGVMATVDVRGGAPGTIGTDALRLGYQSRFVDAITFAGGSSYGLEAIAGVAAALRARRGGSGDWDKIAFVAGAIIFDLGPRRFNSIYPDKELGRAALEAASPGSFPLGARGAGRFALQGGIFGGFEYRQHSGQGAAFRQVGPTKIAVFTVVNSLGAVVDRQGRLPRCINQSREKPCGTIAEYLGDALTRKTATAEVTASNGITENTTLTLVVTNQKLDFWSLQRLAVQVHVSMARAIQPFHTERDGDVLFAATTGEIENGALSEETLGMIAAEVAWDAVLNSVPELPQLAEGTIELDASTLEKHAGTYEFAPGALLKITRSGDRLFAEATGERDIYGFKRQLRYELRPTSRTEFISANPRLDRLQFSAPGLILNPGRWALLARLVR